MISGKRVSSRQKRGFTQDMGERRTSFGVCRYIRVRREDDRPMSWREVWETFIAVYPGEWAVQFFPPAEDLLVLGPRSYRGDGSELKQRFRMLDDDRELCYEGRFEGEDLFESLDCFGTPNAGCTIIQYWESGPGGGWKDL